MPMSYPAAPRPDNEAERLHALRALGILGTQPEPHFDALCRTATSLFGVPIASVTLVDEHECWSKAQYGIFVEAVPRDKAICAHAILADEVLVVEDTAKDPRFSANAFCVHEAGIRFYAGAPMMLAPGVRVGAVCIVDTVPRSFRPEQAAQLADLAVIAVAHLQLQHAETASRQQADLLAKSNLDLQLRQRQVREANDLLSLAEQLAQVGHWRIDAATSMVRSSAGFEADLRSDPVARLLHDHRSPRQHSSGGSRPDGRQDRPAQHRHDRQLREPHPHHATRRRTAGHHLARRCGAGARWPRHSRIRGLRRRDRSRQGRGPPPQTVRHPHQHAGEHGRGTVRGQPGPSSHPGQSPRLRTHAHAGRMGRHSSEHHRCGRALREPRDRAAGARHVRRPHRDRTARRSSRAGNRDARRYDDRTPVGLAGGRIEHLDLHRRDGSANSRAHAAGPRDALPLACRDRHGHHRAAGRPGRLELRVAGVTRRAGVRDRRNAPSPARVSGASGGRRPFQPSQPGHAGGSCGPCLCHLPGQASRRPLDLDRGTRPADPRRSRPAGRDHLDPAGRDRSDSGRATFAGRRATPRPGSVQRQRRPLGLEPRHRRSLALRRAAQEDPERAVGIRTLRRAHGEDHPSGQPTPTCGPPSSSTSTSVRRSSKPSSA